MITNTQRIASKWIRDYFDTADDSMLAAFVELLTPAQIAYLNGDPPAPTPFVMAKFAAKPKQDKPARKVPNVGDVVAWESVRDHLVANPTQAISQIADALNMKKPKVASVLNVARADGLVTMTGKNRSARWTLTNGAAVHQ